MTDTLLLDTHIALWLENGNTRLGPSTLALIEGCWRRGGVILLSAVTVWEIAQLVHRGRITLTRSVEDWIERFLGLPGIDIVPLSHHAAVGAYRLPDLDHRDPADRLLIATAIDLACPLVTYDERIARFAVTHGAQYGFAVQT